MDEKQMLTLGAVTILFLGFMLIAYLLEGHSLSTIKAKKVGDGQHGTARWATKKEISHTFVSLPEGDVHTLMIGAAGTGKTAYFLYPYFSLFFIQAMG